MTEERPARHWILLVAVLVVVAGIAAVAIQRHGFPYYSGDNDEPVYRYQAEMLRDGTLTVPRTQNEFFRPWLSGPHDDHLVMAFPPGWPSVLMVSDVLTGSMLVAVGVAAGFTVLACFLLARRMLRTTGRAVLATALVALSPFVLVLSGTYLNYVFALGLYLLFGALLLGGVHRDSVWLLGAAGLVLGLAILTRPFDALLFALPFAVYVVALHRHEMARLVRTAVAIGVGVLPGIVVTLVYNAALTGSPTEFPVSVQSGGWSTFGWGVRTVAPDTRPVDFTVAEAFSSLGTNLWSVPTWLLGTYLALALAGYGAWRLWRSDRPTCLLLLGMLAVFPVGYLTWWASALTTSGALDGLGPHYYLPVVVPLAFLAAEGAAELVAHRRAWAIGGAIAILALTAIALPPKITEKQRTAEASRRYVRDVERGLEQRRRSPAVVTLEPRNPRYVMEPFPFLANPPDLDADVLYAIDRGPRNVDLVDQMDGRRAYRLVREVEPGGDLARVPVVVKPQAVVRGDAVQFRTTIVNRSGQPTVVAYVRWQGREHRRVLDRAAAKGEEYQVVWTLSPAGVAYEGPTAPASSRKAAREPGTFAVGAAFARSPGASRPDAAERRYYARTRAGTGDDATEVLTADEQWTYFAEPVGAWLPVTVDGTLRVRLAGG